jgi:hypothetical protein
MKNSISFLCAVAILCVATSALAGNPASTSEMPVALQAIGGIEVMTIEEADAVRGEGTSLDPDFWQDKAFTIGANTGYATGSITLFEGVIATFEYSKLFQTTGPDGNETLTLKVEGNIGGLTGSIGVDQDPLSTTFGELNFFTAGKSLSETASFEGDFLQNFEQHFEVQTLIQNMTIGLP